MQGSLKKKCRVTEQKPGENGTALSENVEWPT